MNVKSPTLSGQTPCKSILPSGQISAGSLQDSQRETGISKTKILVSEPTKIPTGFSTGSRTPAAKISAGVLAKFPLGFWARSEIPAAKSRRDPGGNPAKIPPGFTAGSENSAAKISAGDPASALGAKRNPGGQNLGGIPVVIPPRSRRDSRRGTEIPAAKITAGPDGNPGGIPAGFTAGNGNPGGQNLGRTRRESRWDPAKIPPRSRWLFYKGFQSFQGLYFKIRQDFGNI